MKTFFDGCFLFAERELVLLTWNVSGTEIRKGFYKYELSKDTDKRHQVSLLKHIKAETRQEAIGLRFCQNKLKDGHEVNGLFFP